MVEIGVQNGDGGGIGGDGGVVVVGGNGVGYGDGCEAMIVLLVVIMVGA